MNLSELTIVPVERDREAEFLELMRRHHYLGAPYRIGASACHAGVPKDAGWYRVRSMHRP